LVELSATSIELSDPRVNQELNAPALFGTFAIAHPGNNPDKGRHDGRKRNTH
jgi:hypothetical protein